MKKRWKRYLASFGLMLAIVATVAAGLGIAVRRTPDFYTEAIVPEGETRRLQADECQRKATILWSMFLKGDSSWGDIFTSDHVNSYFQEDFETGGGDKNLPDGFSEPRVQMRDGTIRFGCRYGKGFLSTVVAIELKIWLVANELNTVAVEIVSLKAGALEVPPRWMLEPLAEAARKSNADLSWYRRSGHPVALIRLQANQVRPTYQLQRFEVQQDRLVLQGRSLGQSTHSVVATMPNR